MFKRRLDAALALIGLLVATFSTVLSGSLAWAVGAVDQAQLVQIAPGDAGHLIAIWAETSPGQTFTVGTSGQLDGIAIAVETTAGPMAPLIVDIQAVDASDHPTGPVLASATVAPADVPLFATCCVVPAPVTTVAIAPVLSVTAGQHYALLLHSADPTPHYAVVNNVGSPYPRGQGLLKTVGSTDWGVEPCCDIVFETFVSTVVPHSLQLNGFTALAEAPNAPDLNVTGDWTIEAWFKDDDPNGFNHDWRQILMKGDRNANPEAPYYALIGFNHLLAGVRTAGQDYPIDYNLTVGGLSPSQWHHLAVTFRADLNVLNLWLDGQHISYQLVPTHSTVGNTLPVEIGRNGPTTGKYWLGKLDDVRIWNVVRTGTDITATFRSEINGPQPGLIANWNFDESSGTTAFDSSAKHHDATLKGGATFSTDVHP